MRQPSLMPLNPTLNLILRRYNSLDEVLAHGFHISNGSSLRFHTGALCLRDRNSSEDHLLHEGRAEILLCRVRAHNPVPASACVFKHCSQWSALLQSHVHPPNQPTYTPAIASQLHTFGKGQDLDPGPGLVKGRNECYPTARSLETRQGEMKSMAQESLVALSLHRPAFRYFGPATSCLSTSFASPGSRNSTLPSLGEAPLARVSTVLHEMPRLSGLAFVIRL